MTKKDIPFVHEIECLSYPNPWRSSAFEGEVDNVPVSNPYVIVTKSERKIVGYIIFWKIQDEAQISNIAVHPDYRKLGIAESVMRMILSWLKKEEITFVFLEVRPSNLSARALYKKLGFTPLGLRKDYYRDPVEDALIMGKEV